jgi:hypothetical protein
MCLITWCCSSVKLVRLPDRTSLIVLGDGSEMNSNKKTVTDKND